MATDPSPTSGKRKATSATRNGRPQRSPRRAKSADSRGPATLDNREVLAALRAFKRGDFSVRLPNDLTGVDGSICQVFNDLAQQQADLQEHYEEVYQALAVEGRTHRRLRRTGLKGVWSDNIKVVNDLLDTAISHGDDIMDVLAAISRGDFTRRMDEHGKDIPLQGTFLKHARLVNGTAERLTQLGAEVTRVARETGIQGKLGAQAAVPGLAGDWSGLVDNVNLMASSLTSQVRAIAEVTTAVAAGDLTKTLDIDASGELLTLKKTMNTMVHQLSAFADEVSRVVREVGTEGVLGGQAQVRGLSGSWRELTYDVNAMAGNLTLQVRNIAEVSTAITAGDLSKKITVDVAGEMLDLKKTINATVDQLSGFAGEVTRVAREVGTDGVLGGQARITGVSGVWRELTTNVNSMADNLTHQVRNVAEIASAVAHGDLSRRITVDARGEVLDLKNSINDMVDQLSVLAGEVTRVAREVGVEGKLGAQAAAISGRGAWTELADNVNLMALNLTAQIRDIADVTTAIAQGDLTRKISVDARGEFLELKTTVNTMVEQLSGFADDLTRLATEVGSEGRLGGQAAVRGLSGTWRDLADAVNSMASNLTAQVRSVSEVATAIAAGDLTKHVDVGARGEVLELTRTINTMVDQLSSIAGEVTRVAREVGTEGKLGGQASVLRVRGTWKELTDNVNLMASNLTAQVRDIADVSTAIANGDLGRKITVEVRGELFDLKNTINGMVDQLSSFADQVTRLAREVGVGGKLGGQAEVRGVSGIWKELTDNVNLLASNLTNQVRDIAQVTTAVAKGDLSKTITVEVRGEILQLKDTINTMVHQLRSFADEVTRVAREVGTEGVLGGQAQVSGVSGTWRELTDNVNTMAHNLTEQVRGIATIVTAVANGDLKSELRLDAKGEIATLVVTINSMIGTLSTFADQVTGVARDVGVEGRLGGQADVPGAAGVWRDLTNNVNELAGNLTSQVRAIGDVATAVTKGDLTRTINVEARGEVAMLKDNLNQMIRTLADTTQVNQEQDWLKTNLARFTRMLQGQRDLLTVAEKVLGQLASLVNAQAGAFYMMQSRQEGPTLELFASYGLSERKHLAAQFAPGEGMVGQAAREKKRILVTDVPSDYMVISSALGKAAPLNVAIVPVLFENEVRGVVELSSFNPFSDVQLAFIDQLFDGLGIVIATIEATMRTDELLRQSQTMAEELQTQQEELRQTNEELEEKAKQLTTQRDEVERKNEEVGLAKRELEQKAEQLALTSQYKSQFLANMSHELRTPLNSLLILSRQLAKNPAGNLDAKQVEFADTIHQAGSDLLSLINEILDLAKVESGTMVVDVSEVVFEDVEQYVERSLRQLAEEKDLAFEVQLDPELPRSMFTDDLRLRQVIRNLLSNAIKFTEQGSVLLRIEPVPSSDLGIDVPSLREAASVIAFNVVDTGIGIAPEKQDVIFEAFQQADGGTARNYGGTGLGLSISRELAKLLGGALTLTSEQGLGSTFTLLLPQRHVPRRESKPAPRLPATRRTPLPAIPQDRPVPPPATVPDDREHIESQDKTLLIIEDDATFAKILMEAGRERGFKCMIALTAAEGFDLARHHRPDAVSLDLQLPDMDGWVLLDRLKHDPGTRHIPVHIISALVEPHRGYEHGAIAVLQKPVDEAALDAALAEIRAYLDKRIKQVLVIEDDDRQRAAIAELISGTDVEAVTVESAEHALQRLEETPFDCVIVDLALPGMGGLEFIETVKEKLQLWRLPIIVYTGAELPRSQHTALARLAQTVIIKDVRSPERLVEEAAVLLHRSEADLPEDKREMLRRLGHGDPMLANKKVLVVDDDVRNIFAITAVLEQHLMRTIYAENGREALAKLEEHDDVDAVMMDVMMPEMDGYEAMRRIRKNSKFATLPVIALTAKAMKGDREKCIEAGASDYVTKPVDPDQLLSLLRVWLYR